MNIAMCMSLCGPCFSDSFIHIIMHSSSIVCLAGWCKVVVTCSLLLGTLRRCVLSSSILGPRSWDEGLANRSQPLPSWGLWSSQVHRKEITAIQIYFSFHESKRKGTFFLIWQSLQLSSSDAVFMSTLQMHLKRFKSSPKSPSQEVTVQFCS